MSKVIDGMKTYVDPRQQELIEFLVSLGTKVSRIAYPAHRTVEEGRLLRGDMPGTFTKNLLLKDKKGRLFLVVAEETRSIDLRTLHVKVGANGRLGFASPDIVRNSLGVEPGALTPLALMHDRSHDVTVVLDGKIMKDSQLNFHPLINTESIGLAPIQLIQFITATRHQYVVVELDT
jgi:Ala-tRNA(Pro) deacylase